MPARAQYAALYQYSHMRDVRALGQNQTAADCEGGEVMTRTEIETAHIRRWRNYFVTLPFHHPRSAYMECP